MATTNKKGKTAVIEFDTQIKEIRQLLGEQLKCFDGRTDSKLLLLADLQEYFRRMSEIEMEYSKSLERLSDRFLDKLQRQRSQRKERSMPTDLWYKILVETKQNAKRRQVLSENLISNVTNRFVVMTDDVQRVGKKVREIGTNLQDELLKTVHDMQRKLRKFHAMRTESKAAEAKLKSTEQQLYKIEEAGRKNEKVTKQKEKHQQRYTDCKERAVKAKNEYVLILEAVNQFLQIYFSTFLGNLVDGLDYKYHESFKQSVEAFALATSNTCRGTLQSVDDIREVGLTVEAETDKNYFFEDNQHTFAIPFKFAFISQEDVEENCQISPHQADIVEHHYQLFERLRQVKTETDELQKTVEATSDALKNMHKQWDSEMTKMLNGESDVNTGTQSCGAIKNSIDDLEIYYMSKFREMILTRSLKVRMEAQNNVLTRTLGDVTADGVGTRLKRPKVSTSSPEATAILKSVQKKTKIFGCKLDEYTKITGREIPEVIESCVKFIKKFGLDHQGIFRLSGSSTEINDLKQVFESGRDPLAGLNHWKDINAVAGLLRLYFRDLADPLFPSSHYQDFIKASRFQTFDEGIQNVSAVINTIPESNIRIMKYLFRFLFMISEHSENNKMDAHNLAVVFGPTLFRIPTEQDMIAYQSHVNGMMELIIKHTDQVFPGDTDADGPTLSETEDSGSEEDFGPREAEALFNYSARSSKELSFKKGDIIKVYKRFNDDWWDGYHNDTEGFVPASYIRILPEETDGEVPDSDSGCVSPTSETPPKVPLALNASSEKPKDLNFGGPPKAPKRDGSLKKKSSFDLASPVATSPQSSFSDVRQAPHMAVPFPSKTGFGLQFSSDEILLRQKQLRSVQHKDDSAVPSSSEKEMSVEPRSSTFPRSSPSSSPSRSMEDLTKATSIDLTKDDSSAIKAKNSQASSVDEDSQSGDSVCQAEPPGSPRSHKAPPPVKPKPSRPTPPSKNHAGSDLIATLHAAHAARGHRPPSVSSSSLDNLVDEEKKGGVKDDTFL